MKRIVIPILVLTAILLLAGGGVALAVHNNSNEIYACYKNSNGQLRVIDHDAGDTCLPSETEIFWNQQGIPGSTGQQGLPGTTGPVSGWEKVSNTTSTTTAFVKTIVAICPSPKKVVGGGARTGNTIDTSKPRAIIGSFPTGSGNGWIAESMNAKNLTAFAICANVAP